MRKWLLAGISLLLGLMLASNMQTLRAAETSLYERSILGTVSGNAAVALQPNATAAAKVRGYLQPSEPILLLGQVSGGAWLWAHTSAGYGYVQASSVSVAQPGKLAQLTLVDGALDALALPPETATDDPVEFPILPDIPDYSHTIFERGQALGLRPDIFSKVGDCLTSDGYKFLGRISDDNYELGKYGNLQEVITFYREASPREGQADSFANNSIAAYKGFNAASVLDPLWLMTDLCPLTDSSLTCEYRLSKPAVAVIMFGANDINTLLPEQFDFYLRAIIHTTIDHGIVPILSTFPGNPRSVGRSHQFNQITYQIARDYQVPIMNLWLALQPLPLHGREADTVYLTSTPQTFVTHFTPDNLQYGYTMRNLLTLQSLDIVWREVIGQEH